MISIKFNILHDFFLFSQSDFRLLLRRDLQHVFGTIIEHIDPFNNYDESVITATSLTIRIHLNSYLHDPDVNLEDVKEKFQTILFHFLPMSILLLFHFLSIDIYFILRFNSNYVQQIEIVEYR